MSHIHDSVTSLRKELKEWEHTFISDNNRSPTKQDIKSNPSIRYKYKQYSQLKKSQVQKNQIQLTPRHDHHTSIRDPRTASAKKHTSQEPMIVEIGPTPQIFGTSISIFELNLSPIKRKLLIPMDDDLTVSDDDIEKQFAETASETDDTESPVESEPETIDSPFIELASEPPLQKPLLQVPQSRFSIDKRYGPNSPLKLPSDLKLSFKPQTPAKKIIFDEYDETFATPPIWKRSITKSLRDLEDEYLEISRTFVPLEGSSNKSGTVSDGDNTEEAFKKGKRRKNRIKRLHDPNEEQGQTPKINLHKQLNHLKKKQLKTYMNELEMDPSENGMEEVSDSDTEEKNKDHDIVKAKKPARKKKYNLVSNNFRRLKLPSKKRTNASKRFFSRRH